MAKQTNKDYEEIRDAGRINARREIRTADIA